MVSMATTTLSPVWRHYSEGLWLRESKPEVKPNTPYVKLKLPKGAGEGGKQKEKSGSLSLNYICLMAGHVFVPHTEQSVRNLMGLLCFRWILMIIFPAPSDFLTFILVIIYSFLL